MQKILNILKQEPLKNIEIINLIELNFKFEYKQIGNSYLFNVENEYDEFTQHFAGDNLAEIEQLIDTMNDEKYFLATVDRKIFHLLEKKFTIEYNEACNKYYLPKSVELQPITEEIKPVAPKDVQIVNDNWPFKSEDSLLYIKKCHESNISGAIYKNNEIIAWCIIHLDGSLGSMFVKEEYRRLNYASQITTYMVSKLRQLGKTPFLFILEENFKSSNLAQKFGFEKLNPINWLEIKKNRIIYNII